jgi:hypothetical protein
MPDDVALRVRATFDDHAAFADSSSTSPTARRLDEGRAGSQDRIMRTLYGLVLIACLLGCGAAPKKNVAYGDKVAEEAPPEPRDVFFEERPGQIWVHGRWARTEGQWMWQEGWYEPEREGFVYCNGRWEKKGPTFVWVDGTWEPERVGFVYLPGYWGDRNGTYVWIQGRWEKERPSEVYIKGSWTIEDGEPKWTDPRWEPIASR